MQVRGQKGLWTGCGEPIAAEAPETRATTSRTSDPVFVARIRGVLSASCTAPQRDVGHCRFFQKVSRNYGRSDVDKV